jgi:hypothetical protein
LTDWWGSIRERSFEEDLVVVVVVVVGFFLALVVTIQPGLF